MGDSGLKTWVSDKLMSLQGFSHAAVVQFVIGLAKQATSPADLLSRLQKNDFDSSTGVRSFAEELFARVPRRAPVLNTYQKEEREAAMLARKQRTYAILDADDEDDDGGGTTSTSKSTVAVASEPRRSETHKKRFRKKVESDNDEDDEQMEEDRRVKRRASQNEDSGSESEEERLRDQKEREELEQNIRNRDAAATRKLAESKLSKKEEEEAVRRSNALETDGINTLRKVSRQEYLKKREEKKLDELREDILDEEYLFQGVKLSESEYRELKYKKELYELVKKRSEEDDNVDEYRMPEAYDLEGGVNQEKRFAVAMQRYRDPTATEKMNPFAEQEAWEDHQIGKATLKFGSKNKKQTSDDYQFVFEDQIEFVKQAVMDGDKV